MTQELNQEAYDALQKENEELREKLAQSEKTNRDQVELHSKILQNIRKTVQHGGAVVIRPQEPVDGKFKAEYKDAKTGKQVKKTVKFKDGHQKVRMGDGEMVGAAALMRLAEGGEVTPEELATFPALAKIDQKAAANRLNDLVKMGYPHLVDA